jgi:TatA/E family protein of Tat protein translocase
MFGMGPMEIIFILAIALIVIGPKKLPGLAKSLGRALGEFKQATKDLKDSVGVDDAISEFKKPMNDLKDSVDLKKITKDIIDKPTDTEKDDSENKTDSETKISEEEKLVSSSKEKQEPDKQEKPEGEDKA